MLLQRLAGIVGQAAAARQIGAARKAAAFAGDQQAARAGTADLRRPPSRSSSTIAALSAFSRSGRASVIVATAAGLCSSRIWSVAQCRLTAAAVEIGRRSLPPRAEVTRQIDVADIVGHQQGAVAGDRDPDRAA